jgi:hypothetical protein
VVVTVAAAVAVVAAIAGKLLPLIV